MKLTDGRNLRLVRVASGPMCLIPSGFTIDDLLEQVSSHHVEHSTHPHDCDCLNAFIYMIRAAIYRRLPGGRLGEDLKARHRFRHVLREATRSL